MSSKWSNFGSGLNEIYIVLYIIAVLNLLHKRKLMILWPLVAAFHKAFEAHFSLNGA